MPKATIEKKFKFFVDFFPNGIFVSSSDLWKTISEKLERLQATKPDSSESLQKERLLFFVFGK